MKAVKVSFFENTGRCFMRIQQNMDVQNGIIIDQTDVNSASKSTHRNKNKNESPETFRKSPGTQKVLQFF